MPNRPIASLVAGLVLLTTQVLPSPAHADNPMGYRLLSSQDAARLPHNGGGLGMDIDRAQQITDGGMTFDLIRVKQVRPGSAGGRAGFRPGDEIIAVDGQVFPSLAAFAGYVGSVSPGSQVSVDYIPAGGGPAQAQRVAVAVGGSGPHAAAPAEPAAAPSMGMSTRTKLAIGAGAVALLGCYELGCFSHHAKPPPQPQSGGVQPR